MCLRKECRPPNGTCRMGTQSRDRGKAVEADVSSPIPSVKSIFGNVMWRLMTQWLRLKRHVRFSKTVSSAAQWFKWHSKTPRVPMWFSLDPGRRFSPESAKALHGLLQEHLLVKQTLISGQWPTYFFSCSHVIRVENSASCTTVTSASPLAKRHEQSRLT